MQNKTFPLESHASSAELNTLSDHEMNSVVAGLEAQGFVVSPIFAADSDAPGLGNRGVQVGEMNAEERKAAFREIGILFAE